MSNLDYQAVVDHFGDQTKTALALGLKQPSVCAWLNGSAVMSESTALRVQKLTDGKFLAVELSPTLKRDFDKVDVA